MVGDEPAFVVRRHPPSTSQHLAIATMTLSERESHNKNAHSEFRAGQTVVPSSTTRRSHPSDFSSISRRFYSGYPALQVCSLSLNETYHAYMVEASRDDSGAAVGLWKGCGCGQARMQLLRSSLNLNQFDHFASFLSSTPTRGKKEIWVISHFFAFLGQEMFR